MDASNNYPQVILWDEGDHNMDIVIFFCGILLSFGSMALLSDISNCLQCVVLKKALVDRRINPYSKD